MDTETIKEVELQAQEERDFESRRGEIPLSNMAWAVLIFVGPITFWPAIILGARGYRQKARDAWHATFVGIAFWGAVTVALDIFVF